MRLAAAVVTLIGASALAAAMTAQSQVVYERNLPADDPAIDYWRPSDDRVARLAARLASGEMRLAFDPETRSYLPSLLEHLDVRVDSQVLVFSKTSLQETLVSPRTPRAIYFSDDVAVAFVPRSGVIELAAATPAQGVVFYSLDASTSSAPRLERPPGCVRCHHNQATLGVPGVYVGSVSTSATGRADFRGSLVTDHRTSLEQRWRGWYVSGTHGEQRHGGNAVMSGPADLVTMELEETQNLTSLSRKFDASRYPSSESDIVALLTLEHQTQMTNLFTRLQWEATLAERDPSLAERVDARIEETVDYMLFTDEVRLQDPIEGVSSFRDSFPRRGPRDEKGRSLRDFDLGSRLFRYPLSFMIYSEMFDGLPDAVREKLYRRLYERLTRKAVGGAEVGLDIVEIVLATKPGLPLFWRRHAKPTP